jgi:uncharacterized repeat protein (TIGR01451 family)
MLTPSPSSILPNAWSDRTPCRARPNRARVGFAAALALATALPALSAQATTDLGITLQTTNATPVAGGAAFAYTITVTNYGPDDALGVVVLDPLPPSIKIANANIAVVNLPSVPGWGLICESPPVNTVGGTIKCTGNMPAPAAGPVNSTATITIVAQVVEDTASGVRTNTATVASNTVESTPNTNPNTASVQVNMQVNAPLSITKSGPAAFVRGSNVVYEIGLTNNGNSSAINAAISDQLPAGTSFVSMFGTGALHSSCSVTPANLITCTLNNVPPPPNGTSRLTVVAKTSPNLAAPGILSNTATITSAGTGTIAVGSATANSTINP